MMRFSQTKWNRFILECIQKIIVGKHYSSDEQKQILSELVQKLQQTVLPDFSELEKRIINILFLKIFSENEECLVVFEKLIESLKNMRECLEFLAIYANKVNEELTDEIMKIYYPDIIDKHYEWQEHAERYVPSTSSALDNDEFNSDLNFIIQDRKKILDEKSKKYFIVFERMNYGIKQVQESIQKMKSCNLEQLLEIIFYHPDELFLDFKSKIRKLFTEWSKIHKELLNFVKFEFSEHEDIVDEDENKRFEQQYGSSEDPDDLRTFRLHNSGQNDDKTNLELALEQLADFEEILSRILKK
jgi:hypothetical protein